MVERVIGMKKRQQEKILKRAGIKLYKGFPVAGLSTLELRVCARKTESNIAKAIYRSNEDAYGMDYLNDFMKNIREASSIENVTGVNGGGFYARV